MFSKSKRVVERSPTKSASSDFRLIVGRVGLQISVPPGVSCPIFVARRVRLSSGMLSSNKDRGMSSSVRYHV